jgi:hypothetical protein
MNIQTIEDLKALREFFVLNQDKINEINAFDISLWGTKRRSILVATHPEMTVEEIEKEMSEDHINEELFEGAEYSCGTAACVLGWAGMMKMFKDRGLRLDGGDVRFNGLWDTAAGQKFFGLSYAMAKFLFSPGEYKEANVGVEVVIKKLNVVISHYQRMVYVQKATGIQFDLEQYDSAFIQGVKNGWYW